MNAVDMYEETAVRMAAAQGKFETLEVLLWAGGNWTAKNVFNQGPLDTARDEWKHRR